MHIKDMYKVRHIAGEHIIVGQGASHADMTKVISLNSTAKLLWDELQGKEFTLADVANVLVNHFGIDTDRAEADARQWAERLVKCGVIAE